MRHKTTYGIAVIGALLLSATATAQPGGRLDGCEKGVGPCSDGTKPGGVELAPQTDGMSTRSMTVIPNAAPPAAAPRPQPPPLASPPRHFVPRDPAKAPVK